MSATDHGSATTYQVYGCRCVACTSANSEAMKGFRQRRYAQRFMANGRLYHPNASHGTTTGYNQYGCRCPECTDARTSASRTLRARKAAVA